MADWRKNYKEHGVQRNHILRAAAMLLALGLGAGTVYAVAAEDAGEAELQTEPAVQAEGTYEALPEEAGEQEDLFAIIAEEEDAEIIPEYEESITMEADPETAVNSIQVESSEICIDGDLYVSEAGEAADELAEDEWEQSEAVEQGLSGECGAQPGTVYWSLDEEGVLTVTGNGPMTDWESVDQTPWFSGLADLREIVIAEGVTSVGTHAFSGAQEVEKVDLAESIERVGAFAFFKCGGFGSVTIG